MKMTQITIRIDSEVLTVGNLTQEELKKREQQREEAIAYIMQEEPEVTREQAAARYDKWRASWDEIGCEDQVPLAERWANDTNPIGFSHDRRTNR